MGKEGITIVTKALRADEISEDNAHKAAAFLLDGFSFFYEDPKSTVSFFKKYVRLLISLSVILFTSRTREGFEAVSLHRHSALT